MTDWSHAYDVEKSLPPEELFVAVVDVLGHESVARRTVALTEAGHEDMWFTLNGRMLVGEQRPVKWRMRQ